jgi:hypothetical protein
MKHPKLSLRELGNWAFWEAGGVLASHGPDTQFLVIGGRLGRVLTAAHLPGLLRGNLEIAGELMPE